MSLDHHVPDRAALEDLTFDAVMGEVDFSGDDPALGWDEMFDHGLRALARGLIVDGLGRPAAGAS
jgi:hypothetical protein